MQWLNKITSLLKKREAPQEYFLALIFKRRTIKAVVWEEKENHVGVVDSGDVLAERAIEEIGDEELVALTDQAIGLAEKTLPANIKTTKTIFGLPEWWVEGNAIQGSFLGKIKKISKELELKPLGFLVIPEAISHLLKVEEGVPPTVLLVFLSEDLIGVTLVRSGRIEASKTVVKEGKSDSETVASIIKSFGDVEILPSRMLLFDGEVSLEEAKQEFISYSWTKELSFLHFPKIDIIASDTDSKAVVSGAAKEMGFSFEEESQKVVQDKTEDQPESAKDIRREKPSLTDASKEDGEKQEEQKEEEEAFGFVKERDLVEELANPPLTIDEKDDENEQPPLSSFLTPLRSLGTFITALKFPSIKIPSFSSLPMHMWTPVIALAIFCAAFISFYLLFPNTTITLHPQIRTLEKDVQITVDVASSSVDKEKKKIPAAVVEIKEEGEKSQKATGKNTVGDKAKGEVTIYNKTENRKTFPKGTILISPSNLRFSLDDETTVASTAAFELTPSSIKAKVTADAIGEESNLPANTNFPFKDFPTSSYFAKNDAPLSGGTKRDIVAVSQQDQEALLVALTDELKSKAKNELSNKSEGNRIVDIEMKEDVSTKKYSKNIGDEAESFSLKLAITFNTLAYKDSDLLELVGSEIDKDVPAGFLFKRDMFDTAVRSFKKEKSGDTLIIHYKATLLPNVDTGKIKNDIVGKTKTAVEGYLRSLPLESFTIAQNPQLPPPLDLLPQRAENITIEIK